ncbi:hypothetical protein [Caballeronia terrestris]|uniref:hypothetical protein n=1 Tax=Caballeronia terrestris TaxID=1226301 RepID=UPI000F73CCF0|nr:hypothetical protein [Caballeronia terrestris]
MTKIVQGTRVRCAGPTRSTTEESFPAACAVFDTVVAAGARYPVHRFRLRKGRAPNTRKMVVLPKHIIA